MLIFILVFLTIFHTSSGTLTGENVCQEKEAYKINVTHFVLRNVTVRSYVWCYRFPPRCTTFSIKQVNDTELREEDGVRYKSICCVGYVLNEDGDSCVAISRCTVNCINGVCDAESKCYCNSGYRGDDCSKACVANRWGRYCRYHCNCDRGTCDSATGHCLCPAGWSGNSCKEACPKGMYGVNCTSTCNCHTNECNPTDGQCIYSPTNQISKHKDTTNTDNGLKRLVENTSRKLPGNDSTRTAVLQKYHTFNIKVINDTESKMNETKVDVVTSNSNPEHIYNRLSSSTTEIVSTQGSTENPSIYWKAHNNFVLTLERVETNSKKSNIGEGDTVSGDIFNRASSSTTEIASTRNSTEKPPLYWKAHDNFVLTLERGSANTKSNIVKDNVTEGTPKLLRMKILKSYNEDDEDILPVNNRKPREEAYLDDGEIHKNMATRSENIFFTIGTVAVLSFLLIGILSLVLAIRRFKRKSLTTITTDDQDESTLKCKNGTRMTVTARSIFHTPLPDPPVINNPVFTTPIETSSTFETRVICSVNISNSSPSCKDTPDTVEMFYDHPPSTGSYRAVALPEPPDKDRSFPLAKSVCANEPVYDEIPSWKPPDVDSNQIYQNDCTGIYINSINRRVNQYNQ